MFYRFKRWRKDRKAMLALRQEVRKIEKKYWPDMAAADNEFEEGEIIGNFLAEAADFQTELDFLKTQKLLSQARKLGIKIPSQYPGLFQERDSFNGVIRKVLSPIGEAQLRNRIRKQKREDIDYYLKIVTALTGLIGTIIGLVAILK
jgi:hypothetical protein